MASTLVELESVGSERRISLLLTAENAEFIVIDTDLDANRRNTRRLFRFGSKAWNRQSF